MATSVYPWVSGRAPPTPRPTRLEMNSSELLRNSEARPPISELDTVSDENSRGKLQNVVANSKANRQVIFVVLEEFHMA